MMAAYERAKILERHRRGKRHAAHAGAVHVLVATPYGYRDLPKHHGGGQARDEIVAEEARVVRPMFEWVGHECATIVGGLDATAYGVPSTVASRPSSVSAPIFRQRPMSCKTRRSDTRAFTRLISLSWLTRSKNVSRSKSTT